MKTIYDVLIQCGECNHEVDHYIAFERPQIKMELVRGVCHRCHEGHEYATVTSIQQDRTYHEREELIEWYEDNRHHLDMEPVSDFFEYDDELGKFVPKRDVAVVSLTIWTEA